MKKTEWFQTNIKPVRPGIYEAINVYFHGGKGDIGFAYWDGKKWGNVRGTVNEAEDLRRQYGACDFGTQTKIWRGLTEPANR